MTYSDEARSACDGHLQVVQETLEQAGVAKQERDVICSELEQQIDEMCRARAQGTVISLDVMDAVLDELDAPEAMIPPEYHASADAPPAVSAAAPASTPIMLSKVALTVSLSGLAGWPLLSAFGAAHPGWVLYFFAQVTALVLSLLSWSSFISRVCLILVAVQAMVICLLVFLFPQ